MLDHLLSAAPGIAWPSLPNQPASQLLALAFQLDKSQYYSSQQLQALQFRQLSALLKHAWDTVPFYRDRLSQTAYFPGQTVTPDWWRRLPVLTRTDIQERPDTLRSQRVPPEHGKVRSTTTSGSTGQPLKVFGTELNNLMWMSYLLREHLWHGYDLSEKLAVIRYSGASKHATLDRKGQTSESWGAPFNLLFRSGPSVRLDVRTDTDIQMAWLQEQQPAYLLTYPSNLTALARYAIEHEIRLPSLRTVRTISEILTPELRALCQQAFGASIVDTYSSNEAGYIAIQCPHCQQYHVQAENLLCEVINDQGEPCVSGETGRVVVTPLHNFAMPLLRYEIRDYAEVGDQDACSFQLPSLKRIQGRVWNMLTLSNGETRWPTFLAWSELAPIRQYQIIQHEVDQLEAKLVTERPLTSDEEAKLTASLCAQFDMDLGVRYTYLDVLRGNKNGKFETFYSKVS